MRVQCLLHAPFEGLGSIEPWLESAGHRISRSPLYASGELPGLESLDALVIMGGPMSVNDEAEYPWLAPEKALVREALRSGRPVLGICLGAQLIASALGSRVYGNAQKEIGWFPVRGVEPRDAAVFAFPHELRAFHWHGETFDLPEGASLLARSPACEHQAFQLGRSAIGLQFHLETTAESARAMVENCKAELIRAPGVQTEAEILSAGPEDYAAVNRVMAEVLAYLIGDAGS